MWIAFLANNTIWIESLKLKVITLCGSMKFEKEMKRIALFLETKYTMCILQCVYNEDHQALQKNELDALIAAHFKKIELSDAIYVVDMHGYIGEQVSREIAFARELGKEVLFYSSFSET